MITVPVDPVQQGSSITRTWITWFSVVTEAINAVMGSGTTSKRPTKLLWTGRPYFDTTLGKPIWYEGPGWVDATGGNV